MKRALYGAIALLAGATLIAILYLYAERLRQFPVATNPADSVQVIEPGDKSLLIVLDSEASYQERLLAIKRLPNPLNQSQVEALRELIRTKGVHATIRNDLVLVLNRQPEKPLGIAKELIQMYRDESEDATWRDYCLQHLEKVYDFSSEKELIEATLFEAAAGKANKNNNYPGTAMLSLARLAQRNSQVAERLNELARRAVAACADDPERAVTALQVARANKDKSVLPDARRIAADEKALVRLRMSAIGVLGELGGQEDMALLKQLAKNADSRVQNAAKAGLEKRSDER
ncbi:MAG: hypothetical protein V1899_07965 [Planctomycetota bacterium]